MELKVKNGMVEFLLISGKDRVRNSMREAEAKELLEKGKVVEKDGQIIVNGKFIFGEPKEEEKEEPKEEITEEPKKEKKRSRRRKK